MRLDSIQPVAKLLSLTVAKREFVRQLDGAREFSRAMS
jgi:hypothetical protein